MSRYSLLPSMQTGVAQLDAEHQDLVGAINRIDEAERGGDLISIVSSLNLFRNELAGHFANEEHYLRVMQFPGCDGHISHHTEVVAALDRMREAIGRKSGGVAALCFTELLATVVTMDMHFLNWLETRRSGKDAVSGRPTVPPRH